MTKLIKPACAHAHGRHANATIIGEGAADSGSGGFRFGRLVPQGSFQPLVLKQSFAQILGREMVKPMRTDDSPFPAGYTYFGQFVDHDITRDITEMEADDPTTDPIEPTPDSEFETMQGRSPALDLDSLYGHPSRRDDSLFRDGGPYFKIGRNPVSPGGGHSDKVHTNDLPRRREGDPGARGDIIVTDPNGDEQEIRSGLRAAIPDMRNDENLVVGQTHLMWMLFHNNIVGALEAAHPDKAPATLFAEARAMVTLHYQHIVLHDFVRRLITEDVYKEVIVNQKRSLIHCGPGEVPFMPLEFSVAAYRLGHSMVRQFYEWNINFSTGGALLDAPSPFALLFQFSGLSGTLTRDNTPGDALPSNWIADYRRLYDLGAYKPAHLANASPVDRPEFAKKIDPYLAPVLDDLPADKGSNLAFLNLRRGSLRGLPSGQDVSRHMSNVKMLSKAEMKRVFRDDPSFDSVMERHGFYERTPLWLYILIEAAARQQGDRLGEMGSRIVAETFLTLAMCSRVSIFGNGDPWTPEDAEDLTKPVTPLDTIAGILEWIDRAEPIVNPLEDLRVGPL